MGASIESVVVIERPVKEVFEFLLDLEQVVQLVDEDVESVEKTPEGPIGAGTIFRVHRKARGRAGEFTRYTAVERNRKIEFEARFGPVAPTGSLTLDQANGGTRVTFRGNANPVGLFKLLSPLIVSRGQRAWDMRLARIKAILEAPRP